VGGVAGAAFKYCYPIVWITVSARRATGFFYRGGYTGGGVLTGGIWLMGWLKIEPLNKPIRSVRNLRATI